MTSSISATEATTNGQARPPSPTTPDWPTSVPTLATQFAPPGCVLDDSARGTIFWEAEPRHGPENVSQTRGPEQVSEQGTEHIDEVYGDNKCERVESAGAPLTVERPAEALLQTNMGHNQGGGKTFRVEWVSTTKLSFGRTSDLRNPWNQNRRVKVARDGTELEPAVGRQLLALFAVANP
ncbi:hypothetical protein ANO11243_018240 [Dothideomycetidae sp. 11243]|nr:hypothetical protein ANO11243_018240 [fungal sp. No.11243]